MEACKTAYSAIMLMYFMWSFAMSGTAPGLPTDLKLTLHIALVRVTTTQDVVGWIGIDVTKPDISKNSVLVTFTL